jgi:mercuric ion transport protein
MRVQLLSFPGCPNVQAVREALRRSLASAGLPVTFEEVDVTAPETPEHLRGWGSPTILVNGADVAGESPAGVCCRLYANGARHGVPSEEMIDRALSRLSTTAGQQ